MQVILKKNELEKHPSLVEAFSANQEALQELDELKSRYISEIEEIEQKIEIAKKIGMSTQGLKAAATRLKNQMLPIERQKIAYTNGYLEMPDLDQHAPALDDSSWWGVTLNKNVPLRVFKAVEKAHELGCFEKLVLYRPDQSNNPDPIIGGRIGDRVFFITSYR